LSPSPGHPDLLYQARVTRSWAESETLRGLAFTQAEVSHGHARPGQFVRVAIGTVEKPFALASEPGAPELELLYKADALPHVAAGQAMRVGVPQGKGFPVLEHQDQHLILCAAGTGIAPLRALVRTVLPIRERFGQIVFFYGQRTMTHFAYASEHAAWAAHGIELHLVASEAGRRLQEAVKATRFPVADACAYLCGMKALVTDLGHILEAMGLPRDRVFLNF
jgi:ferredoxin-NADP reductase